VFKRLAPFGSQSHYYYCFTKPHGFSFNFRGAMKRSVADRQIIEDVNPGRPTNLGLPEVIWPCPFWERIAKTLLRGGPGLIG